MAFVLIIVKIKLNMFYANQGFFLSNDENFGFLLYKELKIIKIN